MDPLTAFACPGAQVPRCPPCGVSPASSLDSGRCLQSSCSALQRPAAPCSAGPKNHGAMVKETWPRLRRNYLRKVRRRVSPPTLPPAPAPSSLTRKTIVPSCLNSTLALACAIPAAVYSPLPFTPSSSACMNCHLEAANASPISSLHLGSAVAFA